jgi:phage FluMu protein Com
MVDMVKNSVKCAYQECKSEFDVCIDGAPLAHLDTFIIGCPKCGKSLAIKVIEKDEGDVGVVTPPMVVVVKAQIAKDKVETKVGEKVEPKTTFLTQCIYADCKKAFALNFDAALREDTTFNVNCPNCKRTNFLKFSASTEKVESIPVVETTSDKPKIKLDLHTKKQDSLFSKFVNFINTFKYTEE